MRSAARPPHTTKVVCYIMQSFSSVEHCKALYMKNRLRNKSGLPALVISPQNDVLPPPAPPTKRFILWIRFEMQGSCQMCPASSLAMLNANLQNAHSNSATV